MSDRPAIRGGEPPATASQARAQPLESQGRGPDELRDLATLTAKLREAEDRYYDLYDNSPDMYATVDVHTGLVVECNRTLLGVLGVGRDEVVGRPVMDRYTLESREAGRVYFEQFRERGEVRDAELRLVRSGGPPLDVSLSVSAVRDGSGRIVRGRHIWRDITERKIAETALRQSEERYRAMVEGQSELVCRFRPDGHILFANGAYARACGRAAASMIGENFWQFVPEDDRPAVRAMLDAITRGSPQVAIENRFETADGVRWTLWTNRGLCFGPDGRATELQSAGIDITDRKLAESALQASEERFRLMADAAPVMIWMSGTDKHCTWFNRQWLAFVGRPMEAEVGEGWAQNVHPDDVVRCVGIYHGSFDSREAFSMEYRLRRHDGEYRWLLDHGVPTYGAGGRFTGYIGSCMDVTDLRLHREHLEKLVAERTAELEESHNHLRLSERMSALGTLSAGLGHDMGNVLVPMRVWLEDLGTMELPERGVQDVQLLRNSTDYLRTLAAGLRSLSLDPEKADASPGHTLLEKWWSEVHGLYKAPLRRGVTLNADSFRDIPPVGIPSHALTQVVFNLVQNAGDAMRERGTGNIWIGASVESGVVRLSVRDDGPGMTPEVLRRCMEPFFTTKSRGRGTGLGLSIVHGVLKRYGGAVDIASRPGEGTRFVITLPPAPERPPVRRTAVVTLRDPRLAALARSFLSGMGVETRTSTGGAPLSDLWVVDETVPEQELLRFTDDAHPGRRVVLVGPPSGGSQKDWSPVEPKPSALREALARAAQAGADPR